MSQTKTERPLSPHLFIYRMRLTFLMSGFHRVTGIVLYFGIAFLAWWLVAAASGPKAFSWASWFFGSFIGFLVLFGLSWALIHHAIGGIRHFAWDLRIGLTKQATQQWALATIVASVALTILLWIIVLIV
ncbi:succinate dehydrogenase, cytochrome b556 subunit [Consotaella aegiceratis]|uniref:succinate dehydrogenase, cytochrome b556 subunit n=1 Tax=Consotaella aegiceratis TaxID=3097961 RepID=UPI002F40F7CA